MRHRLWVAAAFAATCSICTPAGAQPAAGTGAPGPAQGRPDGPPRRGPPPEAIAVCEGKAAGAACSFTGREGQVLSGTCFAPPRPPGPGGIKGGVAQGGANGAPAPGAQGAAPPVQAAPGTAVPGGPPLACRPAGMGPPGSIAPGAAGGAAGKQAPAPR